MFKPREVCNFTGGEGASRLVAITLGEKYQMMREIEGGSQQRD